MNLQTSDTYENLIAAVQRGESLPISWYTDPAVTDQETTRIFRRTWQYIGPARELQNVGDYIAVWQATCRSPLCATPTDLQPS
jgi:hypothetical protein